jgi:hypothetical protein
LNLVQVQNAEWESKKCPATLENRARAKKIKNDPIPRVALMYLTHTSTKKLAIKLEVMFNCLYTYTGKAQKLLATLHCIYYV